eukprot:9324532-Pyramimonas_sp.AAC.1
MERHKTVLHDSAPDAPGPAPNGPSKCWERGWCTCTPDGQRSWRVRNSVLKQMKVTFAPPPNGARPVLASGGAVMKILGSREEVDEDVEEDPWAAVAVSGKVQHAQTETWYHV